MFKIRSYDRCHLMCIQAPVFKHRNSLRVGLLAQLHQILERLHGIRTLAVWGTTFCQRRQIKPKPLGGNFSKRPFLFPRRRKQPEPDRQGYAYQRRNRPYPLLHLFLLPTLVNSTRRKSRKRAIAHRLFCKPENLSSRRKRRHCTLC